MKDIAFERAIEGELIPVFANGKHMGFRRKRNDALLMFVLRHYGKDASGKRTTINYFSSRASAGAVSSDTPSPGRCSSGTSATPRRREGGAVAAAETSHTTVTTVITGGGSGEDRAAAEAKAAALIEGFEGIALDDEARAEIMAALQACAAREQALEAAYEKSAEEGLALAAEEPDQAYLALPPGDLGFHGTFEPPYPLEEVETPPGEDDWRTLGAPWPEWATQEMYEGTWRPAPEEKPKAKGKAKR